VKHINRLRVLRAGSKRRWTQHDLALRVGMTQSRYWLIENGYKAATPVEQRRIARALRVDVAEAFPSQAMAS
jgi:transcriptional regulator with XRE-family HTH domain